MAITERILEEADELRARWRNEERWRGVTRPYDAGEVVRLRGRIRERHLIAETSAEALWSLLTSEDHVAALGCLTGGQAVECARAGLRAIYLSGWQVAADANTAQQTYPDQSLYPASSVPTVVRRLNNALRRADQVAWAEGDETRSGDRTEEGFFRVRGGMDAAIERARAYAPYADMLWCETATPELDDARAFAEGVHAEFPGKLLAYNCSPSFNWKQRLDDEQIAAFQKELGAMGYRFQFITLAGFHALNVGMFELAKGFADEGMTAYVRLQQREFALEPAGYTAVKHQREVGTGWFDLVSKTISRGQTSTLALEGSTETNQF